MIRDVLSIRQPWCWAILHAGKRVENRSRRDDGFPQVCAHRGPLLLHASATMTKREHREAAAAMHARGLVRYSEDGSGLPVIPFPAQSPGMPGGFHLGGIIGTCNVIGHLTPKGWFIRRHRDGARVEDIDVDNGGWLDLRWWGGGYALVLDGVRPLPFVACKGARGIWRAPEAVITQLRLSAG
jgi:hypothetical protein